MTTPTQPNQKTAHDLARQLQAIAMGDFFDASALRFASKLPICGSEERALLERYAQGAQSATDHLALQNLSNRIALVGRHRVLSIVDDGAAERIEAATRTQQTDTGAGHSAREEHRATTALGRSVSRIEFDDDAHAPVRVSVQSQGGSDVVLCLTREDMGGPTTRTSTGLTSAASQEICSIMREASTGLLAIMQADIGSSAYAAKLKKLHEALAKSQQELRAAALPHEWLDDAVSSALELSQAAAELPVIRQPIVDELDGCACMLNDAFGSIDEAAAAGDRDPAHEPTQPTLTLTVCDGDQGLPELFVHNDNGEMLCALSLDIEQQEARYRPGNVEYYAAGWTSRAAARTERGG